MSTNAREEINFWPGYVDALINVLLNLLFLVGIFTVGLVVLNVQSAIVQKEMARQKIREMLEGSSPAQQQQKAQALLARLPVAARPAQVASTPVAQEAPEVPGKEIRVRRKPFAAQEAAAGQIPGDMRQPFAPSLAVEQLVERLGGGRVLGKVSFGIDQFVLSDPAALPVGVGPDTAQNVTLLVISEPSNPRMASEAFSRLMAVSALLVNHAGFSARQIQIKVLPRPHSGAVPSDMELSVFIVAPQ